MGKSEIWKIIEYLEEELKKIETKLKSQISKNEAERERMDQEWATVTAKFDALRKASRAHKKEINAMAYRAHRRKKTIRKFKAIGYGKRIARRRSSSASDGKERKE